MKLWCNNIISSKFNGYKISRKVTKSVKNWQAFNILFSPAFLLIRMIECRRRTGCPKKRLPTSCGSKIRGLLRFGDILCNIKKIYPVFTWGYTYIIIGFEKYLSANCSNSYAILNNFIIINKSGGFKMIKRSTHFEKGFILFYSKYLKMLKVLYFYLMNLSVIEITLTDSLNFRKKFLSESILFSTA